MKKKSNLQSAFLNPRFAITIVLCLTGILIALGAGGLKTVRPTRQKQANSIATPTVLKMVGPVVQTEDLRRLPYVPANHESEEEMRMRYPHHGTGAPENFDKSGVAFPLVQRLLQPPTMPAPLLTFDGINSATGLCGCLPPDTDGDVGPNHYIESVNSSIQIYDKTGTTLSGPTTYNSFFAALAGSPCAGSNQGDGFVFYDHIADRWVVSDFAFPAFPGTSFYQCVGVSMTSDPVAGGWWLYAIQTDAAHTNYLGDYPKFALWPDAYYFTVNLFSDNTTFNGVRVFALDRAAMINGNPATAVAFTLTPAQLGNGYSLLPATFVPAALRRRARTSIC